jgi:hypothetical protein
MESFAHPNQEDTVSGRVGTTSATGRPNRVTRTGAPVRRTSSRTAKHVALNFEIGISRIFNLYHSPIPWSECRIRACAEPAMPPGSLVSKLKPPKEAVLSFVELPRPLQKSGVIGKCGVAGFPLFTSVDLQATVYYALGIDPDMVVLNHLNQPRELLKGKVVADLWS